MQTQCLQLKLAQLVPTMMYRDVLLVVSMMEGMGKKTQMSFNNVNWGLRVKKTKWTNSLNWCIKAYMYETNQMCENIKKMWSFCTIMSLL